MSSFVSKKNSATGYLRAGLDILREYLDAIKPDDKPSQHPTFTKLFYGSLVLLLVFIFVNSFYQDRLEGQFTIALQPTIEALLPKMSQSPLDSAHSRLCRPWVI